MIFFFFSRRNTHKYVSGCCREDLCNANLPLVLNITNTEENNHNSSNLYGSFKLEVLLPIIFSAILLAAIIGLVTGKCTLYCFPQIMTGLDRLQQIWTDVDRSEYSDLVWIGLIRSGEVWTELERSAKVWTGLLMSGQVWKGLDRSGLVWTGLDWSAMVWKGLERCGKFYTGLERSIQVWTGLDRSGQVWTGLTRSE